MPKAFVLARAHDEQATTLGVATKVRGALSPLSGGVGPLARSVSCTDATNAIQSMISTVHLVSWGVRR